MSIASVQSGEDQRTNLGFSYALSRKVYSTLYAFLKRYAMQSYIHESTIEDFKIRREGWGLENCA
jgi:hypothetical protein